MKRKVTAGILALILSMIFLTGCRIGNTEFTLGKEKVTSKAVFTVNEKECSLQEARLYLCNYRNLYGTAYGINLWENIPDKEELEVYVKSITLSELIRIVCMDLLAEEQEIELTEEERNLAVQAAEVYYATLSKDEIAFMDITQKDIEEFYCHYAIAQKLYNSLTQGVNEEVSDDEARVIHVMQIYVTDAADADNVTKRLEAEEDFVAVASSYNEAESIEITVARGEYPKEVEQIAFNLDNDGISEKISAEGGYYFIKCINKFDPDLTEANKANIRVRREKELFDDVYNEFVEGTVGELNEELWNQIVLDDTISITTDSFFSTYEAYFKHVKSGG